MSEYSGINNLNELSVATPLDGASQAELAAALRQLKAVIKNVLLQAHTPTGGLRGVSSTSLAAASVGSAQLAENAILTIALADLAVTEAKLALNAVTSTKIANGAVTFGKLAEESVGASNYKAASIPLTALAQSLTSAYIQNSSVDNNLRAITSDHIKDLAILDRMVADVALGKLTGGVEGQIAVRGSSGWTAVTPAGGLTYNPGTGTFSIESPATAAYFGDLKARGADGGGSIANTWVTRDLGEVEDGRNLMTFTGNTFRLIEGSYLFYARCPVAGAVGRHQARLFQDNGDSTNIIPLWGTSELNAASQSGASIIQGTLEVTDASLVSFKIEHYCENTVATSGLGRGATSNNTVAYGNHNEVFTTGYLIKLT